MQLGLEESLSSTLFKASLLLKNNLHKELKKFAITIEQWTILKTLYKQDGCNQQEMYNQKELAKQCYKDQASLTRILDILEKKELVKRDNSSRDRREFLICISLKGKILVEKMLPVVQEIVEGLNVVYTNDEMCILENLLNKLIKELE